jgi:hypothetical protein
VDSPLRSSTCVPVNTPSEAAVRRVLDGHSGYSHAIASEVAEGFEPSCAERP